ncbi:MAG TPA: tRNA (N(6)-L-threonylcarbamoyladenosine(37)-C(2))-methylthiotransferase MtaB [Desulfobacterales bacterium]|nr:tRNA (N(6)-L-threonylcarbamoyladenosine(37)-C(2))-methylthiotransferase MtaB [Desulfobacterales bacterium]
MNKKSQRTAAITTLGCKVNQYESAAFISRLQALGVRIVPFSQAADIYIINSCAVTGKAGAQSRQMIRRARRANPEARIVATGCYTQVEADKVREIAGDNACLVGNDQKHLLIDIALGRERGNPDALPDIGLQRRICRLPVRRFAGRARAYLKVEDGCNNFCTYCIVPYTRGRVRSLPLSEVLGQTAVFAGEGYRELVVTGIHVGHYGRDLRPVLSFTELVRALDGAEHDLRYRISSLEPGELDDELLEFLAASRRFMPHFHLPLQSGDPLILRRMRRRYTVDDFRHVVLNIQRLMPEAAIGLDTVVGFPGEDEDMFRHTCELIADLPITYLHVFPYSKRPGTPAAEMPDQVPAAVKQERAARLRELGREKRIEFYQRQLGRTHKVLAENAGNRFKLMKGFSENYVPIHFKAPAAAANTVLEVEAREVRGEDVFGVIVGERSSSIV